MKGTTTLFDGLASAYDRHRPAYDASLFEALVARAPAETKRALDVAAGTGLSTAALLAAAPSGWRITALEPSADMRRVLDTRFAAEPRVDIVEGTAETMGFGDACFGLITVCIAFHWLDAGRFLAEARRVLIPGGVLAVVSYIWEKQPLTEALDDYLFQDNPAHQRELENREAQQATVLGDVAGFGALRHHALRRRISLTADQLINLLMTRSPAKPLMYKCGQEKVEADFRAICSAHSQNSSINVDYNSYAFTIIKAADD